MSVVIDHVISPAAGVPCLLMLSAGEATKEDLKIDCSDLFGHTITYAFVAGEDLVMTEAILHEVSSRLADDGIKRVTLCASSECSTLAIAFALAEPKLVRRVIFLNPEVRQQSARDTFLSWLERFLPLGLPFRKINNQYDASSFLHRLSVPALVIQSLDATSRQAKQSEMLASRVPTIWLVRPALPIREIEKLEGDEVKTLIRDFLEVPAKRPQKKLARG